MAFKEIGILIALILVSLLVECDNVFMFKKDFTYQNGNMSYEFRCPFWKRCGCSVKFKLMVKDDGTVYQLYWDKQHNAESHLNCRNKRMRCDVDNFPAIDSVNNDIVASTARLTALMLRQTAVATVVLSVGPSTKWMCFWRRCLGWSVPMLRGLMVSTGGP